MPHTASPPAAFADLDAAQLVAALPDGAALVAPGGVIVDVNASLLTMLGLEREDLVGDGPPYWWLAPPVLIDGASGPRADMPVALTRADGSSLPALLTEAPLGDACGSLLLFRDRSDRIAMEHALRHTPSGLAGAFESAPTAMAILTGEERPGILARTNQAFRTLAARVEDELAGLPLTELAHEDDRPRLAAGIATAMAGDERVRETFRVVRGDGAVRFAQLSVRGVRGEGLGFVEYLLAHVEDVTDQRAIEADLARQANTDPLTGLLNARSFRDRLDGVVAAGTPGAVLVIDLDDFKAINDGHGHLAGDQVLRDVAARLLSAARTTDAVARIGGDEFALLCPGVDDRAALTAMVIRLSGALERGPRVAASVGAALLIAGDAADDVLRRADAEMYRRKRAG